MSVRPHPFRWVPAFLVGISAATAAEVAVGLLLYSGPGLVRSLTTVLGVEAAAFGVGLWTAPAPKPDVLDSLRRRWLLCLVSFLAATLFSAFWSVVEMVGGSALGQGLGLALMGGLPLYACGGVFGSMSSANAREAAGSGTPIGAPAFLGAALGFAATGVSLPQVLTPASLLLACLVLLSAGGLVYGSVLDAHLRIYVRARRVASAGDVRVEDRHLLARDGAGRFLLEGEHVRQWLSLGAPSPVPWDVAAFKGLHSGHEAAYRVLLLGGGASTLPLVVTREHPDVLMDVTERAPEVIELAREHMDVAGEGEATARIQVGHMEDLLEDMSGPYHLVLVDSAACEAVGGLSNMSRRLRALLWTRVDRAGALVVGPHAPDDAVFAPPETWARGRYHRRVSDGVGTLRTSLAEEEVVLVARPPTAGPLPSGMDGFCLDGPDPEPENEAAQAEAPEPAPSRGNKAEGGSEEGG